jgi:hypothetical protein
VARNGNRTISQVSSNSRHDHKCTVSNKKGAIGKIIRQTITVNDNSEKIFKEAIVAYFKVCPQFRLDKARKPTKSPNQIRT